MSEENLPAIVSGQMHWGSIIPEIRLMILNALVQDGRNLAPYATVCREWQAVVEKKNFERLHLTPPRLSGFGDMDYRLRPLVKYIWLCVELQEYDCSECGREETDSWWEANTVIIEKAIGELLMVLSKWEPNGSLLLDISVHSPSDSKHHLKYIQFGANAILEFNDKMETENIHDPQHGWINGTQVSLPSESSIDRLFEDIEMHEEFWDALPEVKAVTGLLLRRQNRRRWDGVSVKRLLRLLPNLQDFFHEPWRELSRMGQKWTDENSQVLFESLIPNKLRKMVLFEDFNDNYVSQVKRSSVGVFGPEQVRTADLAVSRAVAEASLYLEHLSASFIVDARYFFKSRRPTWVWSKLESLVLTSKILVPGGDRKEINDMLQMAAGAAMKMQRLNSMEIWNGGKGLACVFRYQASKDCHSATITWKGNWNFPLETHVVQSWEKVARRYAGCELLVLKSLLEVEGIESHGHAIKHLKLLHQVVDTVSLWQIQKEASSVTTLPSSGCIKGLPDTWLWNNIPIGISNTEWNQLREYMRNHLVMKQYT